MKSATPVVEKYYQLILWVLPKLAKFPRDQRYLLGDRIERHLLDVMEMLIEAVYASGYKRKEILIRVNLKLDFLRFLVRLAKDMKYMSLAAYDFFCRSLVEIGKMTGGWIKVSGKG